MAVLIHRNKIKHLPRAVGCMNLVPTTSHVEIWNWKIWTEAQFAKVSNPRIHLFLWQFVKTNINNPNAENSKYGTNPFPWPRYFLAKCAGFAAAKGAGSSGRSREDRDWALRVSPAQSKEEPGRGRQKHVTVPLEIKACTLDTMRPAIVLVQS